MNNVWKILNLERNIHQQHKLIYAVDKFSSSIGVKTIIIGFDNRDKSEKIAEVIAKGLSQYKVILIDKSVSSSLLTALVKNELYDLSIYITGDYNDWNSYGFKIKFKKGRGLSIKEAKQIKEYLNAFSKDKTYKIKYEEKVYRGNFDEHYLQYFREQFGKKKLNTKIAYNILGYANAGLTIKLLNYYGLSISAFMSGSQHNHSGNPFDNSIYQLSSRCLNKTDADIIFTNTDGELLSVQTKKYHFKITDIALMLLDINKGNIKKITTHIDNEYIQNFAMINNIKYSLDNKQLICNTPHSVLITNNNSIVDTNYAYSMDANYILLTLLFHLNSNQLSIDDYYENLIETYSNKP